MARFVCGLHHLALRVFHSAVCDIAARHQKEKKFENSIRASFVSVGLGGSGAGEADGSLAAGLTASLSAPFPSKRAGPAELQDYLERRARRSLSDDEYRETVSGMRHDAIGARIQLAASSIFPQGSADLRPEARGALDKIGKLLKESDRRIIIEGHTDDAPIHTARFPTNWELSASRATKIVRYLAQVHGIDGARLTAVAYADQKPVVANDSEEHRSRNRRIEILLVTGDLPTQ